MGISCSYFWEVGRFAYFYFYLSGIRFEKDLHHFWRTLRGHACIQFGTGIEVLGFQTSISGYGGGQYSQDAGVHLALDYAAVSVMGFVEVVLGFERCSKPCP